MNKIFLFIKSTKWVSRILFCLWIIFSIISNFPNESRLQIMLEYAALLLTPAIIIELIKNPVIKNHKTKERNNKFFILCKSLSAWSIALIIFWLFFIIFMSTYARNDIFGVAGIGFGIFCYLAISIFFLLPAFLIEYLKNPIFKEKRKIKPYSPEKKDRYSSISRILAIVFACFAIIGIIVTATNSASDLTESFATTIFFALISIVLFIISFTAPKTHSEAVARKEAKIAKKEELQAKKREQAELDNFMKIYKGIYLSIEQIQRLENRIELPNVDTPVFLSDDEVAVYYCAATRQNVKNRVVGRSGGYVGGSIRIAKGVSIHTGGSMGNPVYGEVVTHYEGEMVLTNKRLVFLSSQKGFEVPYKSITTAEFHADSIVIQNKSQFYTVLIPKPDLAEIAFYAVYNEDLPIANTHESITIHDEYEDNLYDNDEIDYNDITSIDGMDGHDFEYFCAKILKVNGFTEVSVTKGSGDQGVDILATKDGIKYAIQCKNYASALGNTPIQEVNAGKTFYNCHVGIVMTNSTFTPGAKTLAQATGTLLWDRSILKKMMETANL